MEIVRTVKDLRARVAAFRAKGEKIALVPTMGALHSGHISLVKFAQKETQRVVVSIFVNPTQFGPNEDFSVYPRKEAEDAALLKEAKADILFAPTPAEMYPDGFASSIIVGKVSQGLCGDFRPGHFPGVATVVTKLLLQSLPDVAVFGEKDFQQLQVIKRVVTDLDIPVKIMGAPTIREADGLALSSRNAYLSQAERQIAARINQVLKEISQGQKDCAWGKEELLKAGFNSIDYLEIRKFDNEKPRVLVAARLGKTRLIDNTEMGFNPA